MHAGAVFFLAGLKNTPVRVQPPVARQQGWVNVDDLAGKAVDKTGAEHPHKAGQNDMVGLETGHGGRQAALEGAPVRKLFGAPPAGTLAGLAANTTPRGARAG